MNRNIQDDKDTILLLSPESKLNNNGYQPNTKHRGNKMIITYKKNRKDSLFYCAAVNGYITMQACKTFCNLYGSCSTIGNAIKELKEFSENNPQKRPQSISLL